MRCSAFQIWLRSDPALTLVWHASTTQPFAPAATQPARCPLPNSRSSTMCDSPSLSPSSHSSKTAEQHVLQQQQRAAMVRRLREELGPTVDAQLQKGGEEGLTDAVRGTSRAP